MGNRGIYDEIYPGVFWGIPGESTKSALKRLNPIGVSINTPDPVPQPPPTVTITMPLEIAETLLIIGQYIGGDAKLTRRGHMSWLNDALYRAGVRCPSEYATYLEGHPGDRGLTFRNEPRLKSLPNYYL